MDVFTGRWPRVTVVLLILVVMSGCSMTRVGIRPDEPATQFRTVSADKPASCQDYEDYSKYAQELQEAYHSRATMNRGSLYVAGILALAVTAASGGLAAATAVAAGTLALLAVSGGFAAGSFAVIDNKDLAELYTISANSVDTALKESHALLPPEKWYENPGTCGRALRVLRDQVSDARTTLEVARTNVAVGALVRAKEQQRILNELIAAQPTSATRITVTSGIIDVNPKAPPLPSDGLVTLTVANIRLDQVASADVKVQLGSAVIALDGAPQRDSSSETTYLVKFKLPATAPDPPRTAYSPILLVGRTKQAVVSPKGGIVHVPVAGARIAPAIAFTKILFVTTFPRLWEGDRGDHPQARQDAAPGPDRASASAPPRRAPCRRGQVEHHPLGGAVPVGLNVFTFAAAKFLSALNALASENKVNVLSVDQPHPGARSALRLP